MNELVTYRCGSFPLLPDLGLDAFPDGQFAGSLTDLGQIGAGESFGHSGQEGQVDSLLQRRLPQVGLQDGHSGRFVGQRNVDQLIQSARSKDSRVDDVRSVGGADDEDVLLRPDAVHLREEL